MSVSQTASTVDARRADPTFLGRALAWNPLASRRVQYGLKYALAMLLALWFTQVLRLQYPNWAVLSVMVLMNSKYVGATGTKAFMRVLGTVIGGLLAVWVNGDFGNAPVPFLSLIFIFVVIATYKFGQVGAALSPYAWWLVGLALVSVSSYGISDPEQAWRFSLYRSLETLVGVLCATVVNAVLWPRYAREEFAECAAGALGTARALLRAEARAYLGDEVDAKGIDDLRGVFAGQLLTVRNLLQVGAQESHRFRQRIEDYRRHVVALTHLFEAMLDLHRVEAGEQELLDPVGGELRAYLGAVDAELAALERWRTNPQLPPTELREAFATLEARVVALRREGLYLRADLRAVRAFFGHFATLRLIRDELVALRTIAGDLPRVRTAPKPVRRRRAHLPTLDVFWLRQGLKGGFTVCLSLFLVDSFHPPGGTGMILSSLVFAVFSRAYLNAGGTGDLRYFQKVFWSVVLGLPVVALLWLLLPFLSNYWAMNTFLFAVAYAYGYATANVAGVSFLMQMAILGINSIVALNPQRPVAFATLMNTYLGLMSGLVIAALVARLVWPVLPQGIVRGNLSRYFRDLQTMLQAPPVPESLLARTVLMPVEALRAAARMVFPGGLQAERKSLVDLIRAAQPLGMQLLSLRDARGRALPAAAQEILSGPVAASQAALGAALGALAAAFDRRTADVAFPDVSGQLAQLDEATAAIRERGVLAGEDVEAVTNTLELADRHHALADRLSRCLEIIRPLHLNRWLGDDAL